MSNLKFTTSAGLNSTSDDFKDVFISGNFVIDCAEIRLTQNESMAPRIYSSPGYIQVSPEHGAEARLVCPRDPSDPYDELAPFMGGANFTSGVLMPDSHYYRLEARDVAGNIWTHPAIALRKEDRPGAVILTIACDSVRTESAIQGVNAYAYFVFLDELNFPKNVSKTTTVSKGGYSHSRAVSMDGSKGSVSGMRVEYEYRQNKAGENYSEFIAMAADGVLTPKSFQDRLLEAIRFCTATMATPVMSETVIDNVKVIELAKSRPLNNGLIHAPLFHTECDQDFYKLFACYFSYASANTNGKEFAPISSKLGGLFTLKGVWLHTVVLLLGVAVESVLSEDMFKKIGQPKNKLVGDIKTMIDIVSSAPVEETFITRVVNAVSNMNSNSAADKLHALIEAGALEEDDRKSWKRLRNASAHGTFEIAPEKLQQVVDDVYRLTTLIYKLVFMLIGYAGKYSNCAARGWRVDEFDVETYRLRLRLI